MSPRRIISLSGRLARLLVYAALAGLVVFFAVTRTEVGREGLRGELVRQFNRSLRGSLEIGYLGGNVLNRVTAQNVVVRDTAGRPVISIDEVVFHPTWSDVFRRTLSTGHVTLLRPRVTIERDAGTGWNIAGAFRKLADSLGTDPWTFRSTRVDVVDGVLITRSEAPLPDVVRDGRLFDWTNAEVVSISGRALIDWERDMHLIDVLDFEGRLPGLDVDVDSLQGQIVLQNRGIALNEVRLRTGRSAVHINASLSSVSRADPGAAEIALDLAESTIDGNELSRIFPRLELSSRLTASARLRGSIDGLVIERAAASVGDSDLTFEGSIVGLPDSADYDLAVLPGRVYWSDLAAAWPGTPIPSFRHLGPIDYAGTARGAYRFDGSNPRWSGQNEFSLAGSAGRVEGSVTAAAGPGVHVDGALTMEGLDPGHVFRRGDLPSDLNGRIEMDADGPTLRESRGSAALALGPSYVASRRVDSLRLDLDGALSALSGRLFVSGPGGSIRTDMTANLAAATPAYYVEGRAADLDLGSLLANDSLSSRLAGTFLIDGHGSTWTEFDGDLAYALDSSIVSFGAGLRVIPAHGSHLAVRQRDVDAARIVLSGDIADVEITGDVDLEPLALLTRHWSTQLARAVRREVAKPYRRGADAPAVQSFEGTEEAPPYLVAREIAFHGQIHRSDVLAAFLPGLSTVETDVEAGGRIRLGPDRFDVELEANADSLHLGRVRSNGIAMRLTAGSETPVSARFSSNLSLVAEQVTIGSTPVESPSLAIAFADHGFDVALDASLDGAADPVRLRARMDLLDDRNRLVLSELQLPAAERTWTAPGRNVVDVFQEAIYVRGIRLEANDPDAAEVFELAGTLSSSPQDTLFVRASDVQMQRVGGLLGLGSSLGGTLDGRLAFTGLNRRPELTGRVDIEPLTFRDRHVGRLTLTSRYIPGSPDVALHMELTSASVQDSSLRVEQNDLSVNGTFRLPSLDQTTATPDPGALDLDVDIRRADAFFFDFIFRDLVSDVSGYLEGQGHVGGDVRTPLFDAEITVHEGRFQVPEFGLSYGVSGQARVDRNGIHLDDLALSDADDGTAVVGGSILFNDYRFFSFDLHGALDRMAIMNVPQSRELPFYGRIAASGDVSLTGPLSSALLQSSDVRTTPESDLYIPIAESGSTTDAGFIVFADSTGRVPDFERLVRRQNLLAQRPEGERPFLDGLGMDLNILAPEGSTVHLVIDPLLGDVINAVGSGRVQLVRGEGDFTTYGTFTVTSGDYLFTAGEVFFRRFVIDSGTITWDGDPLDAMLAISASYRTRASTDGLQLGEGEQRFIPLVIELDVTGRVSTPIVDLALSIDRDDRNLIGSHESLEALLNQSELAAQYATSVLLTNSFLLTADQPLAQSRGQLAFNSLSQLVASQLNRYINYALPNVDLNLGVQGESTQDLDVTYGVALRMLDERLIIRGQGIYPTDQLRRQQENLLDEFVVEVRLNPRVSVEVFYRREGDIFSTESLNTSTTGAGLSYQTEFSTWRRLVDRLFGWLYRQEEDPPEQDPPQGTEPAEDEGERQPTDIVAGAAE